MYTCTHVAATASLNDAKHMDYFVATTLFRDAPFRRFEAFAGLSKSPKDRDLSWHGKNHYSVVAQVSSWLRKKMSMPLRPLILPKGYDIDLPWISRKKISFNTVGLCLLVKACRREDCASINSPKCHRFEVTQGEFVKFRRGVHVVRMKKKSADLSKGCQSRWQLGCTFQRGAAELLA